MKIFHNERRNRGGFTLIEMTIVLFIILAFLAMSVPFFANFSSSTSLRTTEREMGTILRTARSYAISQNKNYEVLFNTSVTPNTYSIREVGPPLKTIDKIYQLPAGISFAASATIRFASNGGISSDCPTDPPEVTITSSKGNKLISVDKATGAVTMQ